MDCPTPPLEHTLTTLQSESITSPPLNTHVPPATTNLDRPTPRAQTITEAEQDWKGRNVRSMDLAGEHDFSQTRNPRPC